ncbi:alpha/beta hydrolase [Streptomyces sp. NBC_00708]|uniref:alpha/beta fold hydrolase n=1 Tax=Streptomyces sp. col6 TaxID=2478958 RepID=UPI0011CE7355|nr:alpha/beta hydrolase [Streptomyces sp. col6]TXS06424.1 alpha/beta hydrolase [Streptomyces sp. col6]
MSADPDLRPVSVQRRTTGTGRRMLLLHGLAANDSVWDRTVDRLPADAEVWTARLPWRTDGIGDWGQEPNLKGWLAKALEAVPGRAETVVAHSMAANVLLDLLDQKGRGGTDPLRHYGIRSLVLVSPFFRSRADQFDWETISYYLNDFHRIMEEGIRVHSDGRLPADIQEAMGKRVRDRVGPHGWLRFFELYLRTPTLQTSRITVPTLVLAGETDFAAPPAESLALAAALPAAHARVLPGCGHFPMIEAAERFAEEIREFVRHPASAAPFAAAAPIDAMESQR